MAGPAQLTHAAWEVDYDKADAVVIANLSGQFQELLDFVKQHEVPQHLRDLGTKATREHMLKSTVSAVVVGNRRSGKSQLVGHLMFDQNPALASPLPVDDGSEHVTTSLAVVQHAESFSVRLCPLDSDVRQKVIEHADKVNEQLQEASRRIPLPEDGEAIPTDIIDFGVAVTKRGSYQDLLDMSSLAGFKALGADLNRWGQPDQYAFIHACCQVLATSLGFRPLALLFVLEISAPWVPQGVRVWDTPGRGDKRFTPLIQYALTQAEVIIPYNRGAPIDCTTISKCLELLAEADPKRLQTHPPTLLLFERQGKNELEKHRASWAGELPSDEALPQHYCSNVRRAHYRDEVLVAAEEECLGKLTGAPELFNELRNTLMVHVDHCEAHTVTVTVAKQALLHDRGLHQELVHRASFRSVNVWVHACACFIYQARNLARKDPVSQQPSTRIARKMFSVSDDAVFQMLSTIGIKVGTMMSKHWEQLADAAPAQEELDDDAVDGDDLLPLFFDQWLAVCRQDVLKILRLEWTNVVTASLGNFQETATEALIASQVSAVAVQDLFEGLNAEMSSNSFASQPRVEADNLATGTVDAAFASVGQRAHELAVTCDFELSLPERVFEEIDTKLREVVDAWVPCLKRIAKQVNKVMGDSYTTLLQPQALDEPARKELLGLCALGSKLVGQVIIKADAKPPTKTLAVALPKFYPAAVDIPSSLSLPSRKENRSLDVAFDLIDEPFTARLGMPFEVEASMVVAMHAHPGIAGIVSRFKQQSQVSELALPPIIILGCPGEELVDTITATGHSLEGERRFVQRELKPVAALRILLVDQPTYWKAKAYSDNKSETLLVFVVKTGKGYLTAAQLLDYSHLLGAWLAKDETVGGARVAGAKLFVRMESSTKSFKEAGSGIQLLPASPARVFKGMEQALLEETARQEQARAAAIVSKWNVASLPELEALYPGLEAPDLLRIMLVSNRIPKDQDLAQQVEFLKQEARSPAASLPAAARAEVLESLRVEVLSVSPLTEGATRSRWLAQPAATLEKNREQNLRCNYRVRFYKSRCSTYEQTQCVLVNSAVVRGLWACTDQAFGAAPRKTAEDPFWKPLRKAESRVASALKTTVKTKAKPGTKKAQRTVSTGLSCLVLDQFCANSDFRATGKGSRGKRSPAKSTPKAQAPTEKKKKQANVVSKAAKKGAATQSAKADPKRKGASKRQERQERQEPASRGNPKTKKPKRSSK